MKTYIVFIISIIMLLSCSAIKLNPEATDVVVSRDAAPHGCKFLGQIIGNQGGLVSSEGLEEGAMNALRNKAARLGANYVQLVISRPDLVDNDFNDGLFDMGGGVDEAAVTNVGNAYHCSKDSIGE